MSELKAGARCLIVHSRCSANGDAGDTVYDAVQTGIGMVVTLTSSEALDHWCRHIWEFQPGYHANVRRTVAEFMGLSISAVSNTTVTSLPACNLQPLPELGDEGEINDNVVIKIVREEVTS